MGEITRGAWRSIRTDERGYYISHCVCSGHALLPGLALLFMLICLPVMAGAMDNRTDGPFLSPSARFPMPDAWKSQPIRYAPWGKGADLAVSLDQQIYEMVHQELRRYALAKGIKLALQKGTCGISSGVLINKSVDLAGFCCPPGLTDRLDGVRYHTLGIAALEVIINTRNPLDNLSLKTLREVFQGRHHSWSSVRTPTGQAGPDWPIHTIGRFHCKQRPGHWKLILSDPNGYSNSLLDVGTIPDMVSQVANYKGSIGYETQFHRTLYDRGNAKPVRIDGHSPSDRESLTTGKYPLYRVFSVALWEDEKMKNPHVGDLLAHLDRITATLWEAYGIVPRQDLKRAGWRFSGEELIGEPPR